MADNKYQKDLDRMATLYDAKIRIIDLMQNGFELPEEGIYDEPVRYFKANLKWTPIIFGWLTWLQDVAAWKDAEDELYRGITEIMIFEEGIDMTLSDDISSGIYKAFNDLAKQIVSGRVTNIAVGGDGTVTNPSDAAADAGLPADDPLTEINETEASRYGAMVEIGAKLELLLDKADGYYGAANGTPATPLAEAQRLMKLYFPADPVLMDTAMDAYWTYRGLANRILFDGGAAFAQYLYCNGYQNDALNRWIIDVSAYSIDKQQIVANFWEAPSDAFFSHYFSLGAAKPSSVYLDAACVPIEDQVLAAMVFAVTRNTTPFKSFHRMKFTVDGYALDVDGDIQDAFWYRTAAGVNTFTAMTMANGGGITMPSQAQVPYRDNHHYEFVIDWNGINALVGIGFNKHASMNAAGLVYPTPFNVAIHDEGLSVSQ